MEQEEDDSHYQITEDNSFFSGDDESEEIEFEDDSNQYNDVEEEEDSSLIADHRMWQNWAIKCKIGRECGNEFLKNLNATNPTNLSHLPKDIRSLKKVPESKLIFTGKVQEKCKGQYYYFGIERNLSAR